eukprot:scaffold5369_cov374-Prasinococcus_capsulatus_cf.AAC.1
MHLCHTCEDCHNRKATRDRPGIDVSYVTRSKLYEAASLAATAPASRRPPRRASSARTSPRLRLSE